MFIFDEFRGPLGMALFVVVWCLKKIQYLDFKFKITIVKVTNFKLIRFYLSIIEHRNGNSPQSDKLFFVIEILLIKHA